MRVIESCKTFEQLKVADTYAVLAVKEILRQKYPQPAMEKYPDLVLLSGNINIAIKIKEKLLRGTGGTGGDQP
jgi:hypothetical protein